MSWGAEEWSAFGQIVGAAGAVAAAGIAAYTAVQAKNAAESSAATAKQAARALALHDPPELRVMIYRSAAGNVAIQLDTSRPVSGDISWIDTAGARRSAATVGYTGRVELVDAADDVTVRITDSDERVWRWKPDHIVEGEWANVPLELLTPS